MALDMTPGCCGESWCECNSCFEDFLCQIRNYIYPPGLAKALCAADCNPYTSAQCPVFDGIMASLMRPLWEVMRGHCGLCTLPRELDPQTACCLLDCWASIYGIDECFEMDSNVCWGTEQERLIGKRAAIQTRALLDWNGFPDAKLFEAIACPLGLSIQITAPTPSHRFATTSICDLVPDWGPPPAVPFEDGDCAPIKLMTSPHCKRFGRRVCITITAAPCTMYATICSPIGQPLCWNPYVDAFKCLVNKIKPCNLDVMFRDAYAGNWQRPPAYDVLCPSESGHFRRYPVIGEGTPADPFTIDFSLLSPSDVNAIVCRLAQVIRS